VNLHDRRPRLNAMTQLGLLFLIIASLGNHFLRPTPDFSEGFVDGAKGLLYGVAIGCMLVGIAMSARRIVGKNDNCAG